MARLTKKLRDECVKHLLEHVDHSSRHGIVAGYALTAAKKLAACSVDYPDLANHPTTIELEDGRVQITLEPEEWRAIREASR